MRDSDADALIERKGSSVAKNADRQLLITRGVQPVGKLKKQRRLVARMPRRGLALCVDAKPLSQRRCNVWGQFRSAIAP